jgi:hypothetical protein
MEQDDDGLYRPLRRQQQGVAGVFFGHADTGGEEGGAAARLGVVGEAGGELGTGGGGEEEGTEENGVEGCNLHDTRIGMVNLFPMYGIITFDVQPKRTK